MWGGWVCWWAYEKLDTQKDALLGFQLLSKPSSFSLTIELFRLSTTFSHLIAGVASSESRAYREHRTIPVCAYADQHHQRAVQVALRREHHHACLLKCTDGLVIISTPR